MSGPEDLRIPNEATYAPFSLLDVMTVAPLASRVLLGATIPGRVVQLAALGLYARSVIRDWSVRQGMRRVDFKAEFGADVDLLEEQPRTSREMEVKRLAVLLDDHYTDERPPRKELAREVNRILTDYLAGITGQRVETSDEIRDVALAGLVFPFAQGTCDILSGDVAIFRDTGIFEPHVICHEFVHRKGYLKEIHAQALSYLALRNSGHPVMVQAARAERLYRQLRVLSGDDGADYLDRVAGLGMREELYTAFEALQPDGAAYRSAVGQGMRRLYDARMRLTGQNGISDYDRGFTDFLHTFRFAEEARQPAETAAV